MRFPNIITSSSSSSGCFDDVNGSFDELDEDEVQLSAELFRRSLTIGDLGHVLSFVGLDGDKEESSLSL